MKSPRLLYRLRQFIAALGAHPAAEDLQQAAQWLSPQEMALFDRLQPSEQVHSLQVFKSLQSGGGSLTRQPDLLVAALLHDVGKCRHPLRLWERAWIVFAQALLPGFVERWGRSGSSENQAHGLRIQGPWWQRPFVVAIQHPAWGAEMAAEAGSSPLVVALIRRHQNHLAEEGVSLEERLLVALQRVDGVY
jgi:putative nucleotidyltransferase with HDIG domain